MALQLKSPSCSAAPSCSFSALCANPNIYYYNFRCARSRQPRRLPPIARCSSPLGLLGEGGKSVVEAGPIEYLASEYGWKVRTLNEDDEAEIRRVALVQAEAFHTPVALFNEFFFFFFQAEVLSGLLYKLRNSPPNRYACLVAEFENSPSGWDADPGAVGVVDVTVQTDKPVLKHLHGAEEYLYVSGLAVSKSLRRRKIGSSLLRACDGLCRRWGYQWLALKAYEEDAAAQELYSKAGYRVVAADPPWTTSWVGRKRRVVMIKNIL